MIKEYRFLVDEFNEKLQAEVTKSEQLKLMLRNINNAKSYRIIQTHIKTYTTLKNPYESLRII